MALVCSGCAGMYVCATYDVSEDSELVGRAHTDRHPELTARIREVQNQKCVVVQNRVDRILLHTCTGTVCVFHAHDTNERMNYVIIQIGDVIKLMFSRQPAVSSCVSRRTVSFDLRCT